MMKPLATALLVAVAVAGFSGVAAAQDPGAIADCILNPDGTYLCESPEPDMPTTTTTAPPAPAPAPTTTTTAPAPPAPTQDAAAAVTAHDLKVIMKALLY